MNLAWCGYAAFVLGLLHAAASVYWGLGGTAALHTVGGWHAETGHSGLREKPGN